MIPAAVLLAAGLFFVPQRPALSWWSPAFSPEDLHYLKIVCATRGTGELVIQPEILGRSDQAATIVIPLSPSERAYSFLFPLPDVPLTALRLTSRLSASPLEIRSLRIVTGNEREVLRLNRVAFAPAGGEQVAATENGWEIRSGPDNPREANTFARLPAPILARGASYRNTMRCIVSVTYLGGLLVVLLLAGTVAVRPRPEKRLCLTLGAVALLASLVAHRGLILLSAHTWLSPEPPPTRSLHLAVDVRTDRASPAQLFWDTGNGITEEQSARTIYRAAPHLETLNFTLPPQMVRRLRFDPRDEAGSVIVQGLRIVDDAGLTRATIPVETLRAVQQIARLEHRADSLAIRTTPNATDPIMEFDAAGVGIVNDALRAAHLPTTREP